MKQRMVAVQVALLTLMLGVAQAEEIKPARTVRNVDMVAAGIGGIDTGTGSISLAGVNGSVKKAYLYWYGINQDGAYNRASIQFGGHSVTGTPLGASGTNCWGAPPGQSNAYEADVTALVTGNGSYGLSGLAVGTREHADGASLVVLYNDASSGNDRDIVFYTGNDSNYGATAFGDADGWHATLPGISYSGGSVYATLHVADGQLPDYPPDPSVVFSTEAGTVTITDTPNLFDGNSLPSGGNSRASGGEGLYDVHTFNITGAFGTGSGTRTLDVDASVSTTMQTDCMSLVAMTLSFPAGDAPDVGTPEGPGQPATTCASEGYKSTQLQWCQKICESNLTGRDLDTWIHRWIERYRKLPYCAAGGGSQPPAQN